MTTIIGTLRTRPRPAGVNGIFQFLFSACEDARGYSPEIDQRLTSFRTRPRPAGVSGILQFLILRVRGRTRVRYSPRAGTHAGTLFSACGDARGYVVSRPSAAGTGRQLQRRSLDHSRSHSFVGAQGGGKSAQDCFLISFSFSSSMPSPGFVGTLMNPPL